MPAFPGVIEKTSREDVEKADWGWIANMGDQQISKESLDTSVSSPEGGLRGEQFVPQRTGITRNRSAPRSLYARRLGSRGGGSGGGDTVLT